MGWDAGGEGSQGPENFGLGGGFPLEEDRVRGVELKGGPTAFGHADEHLLGLRLREVMFGCHLSW